MPSIKKPCQRDSFSFANVGTVNSNITTNIMGISSTNEELMPPMSPETGTSKGLMVIAAPLTSTKLNRLAPMILPRDREP